MAATLDTDKLKMLAIATWRKGGMDTLVKVMPRGMFPAPGRMTGYCTTFKYVVGRTPADMEAILGFATNSKLVSGAEIYLVRPLPTPAQFELRGYTQLPGGVSTNDPTYRSHKDYPPGLGVPQWELTDYPQRGLHHLATILSGQTFSYQVANLPSTS